MNSMIAKKLIYDRKMQKKEKKNKQHDLLCVEFHLCSSSYKIDIFF